MADVKFMDISENDNPATTDSILIANSQNGVKRTTLGTLGNMFAVKGVLHIEKLRNKLQANTTAYPITAPNVEGYTFAFWLASYTEGDVIMSYVDDPTASSTEIFFDHPLQPAEIQGDQAIPTPFVTVQAVYIKADLV